MSRSYLPILAVILGGLMEGSFALPMGLARRWEWENKWMVYSFVGLLVIPVVAAGGSVPHLLSVYSATSSRTLLWTALFGFGWGVANVLFGVAVPIIGMALSFAIAVGISAALGSLIPLLVSHPERLLETTGLIVLAGVALTTLGVVLLGAGGRARERSQRSSPGTTGASSSKVTSGLIICIMAGLLAPMLNFSFAFGSSIRLHAIRQGASPAYAANAIWVVALAAGFISNGGHCVVRLFKNRTWLNFTKPHALSQYGLSALMGVLWTGGLLLYGWGASELGDLGATIGWPVFQATMVVIASGLGILMGEWRGAGRSAFRTNNLGLATLVVAIIVLSIGNRV